MPWRRAWQPTPIFLPGESHGQRSLERYSPWGCKESDMTEHACMHRLCPHIGIRWVIFNPKLIMYSFSYYFIILLSKNYIILHYASLDCSGEPAYHHREVVFFKKCNKHFWYSIMSMTVTVGHKNFISIHSFVYGLGCHEQWRAIASVTVQFSPVQSLLCVQLFVTPWTAACQASLSITNSRSLRKLMSIESVTVGNHKAII